MSDDQPPLPDSSTGDPPARSLVEDVMHLVEDGRTYLEAELQFQKSRAGVVGSGAGKAALFVALAFAFVLLALLAITVGLLLALSPWVGVWGAMGLVTLGLLISAAVCGLVARARWRAALQHVASARTDGADHD